MTPQEAFKAWSASLDQNLFSHAPEDLPLLEQAFVAGWSARDGNEIRDSRTTNEDDAAAVYDAYPRKEARRAALKAILSAHKRLGTEGPGHLRMHGNAGWDYLLAKTRLFAEAVSKWPKEDRAYVPHPATWFNQDRFHDHPSAWERQAKPQRFVQPPAAPTIKVH